MAEPERLVVVVRATAQCNLSCAFCKYDRRREFVREQVSPAVVLGFAEQLAQHQRLTGTPVLVSFLGGEPFLWPPLLELAAELRERLGLATSVTTNGTALGSSAVRDRARQVFDEITLSVDGFAPLHDELRGWPGGFDSLSASIARMAEQKRIDGAGPLLRANVVLMRESFDDFLPLCRELARLGIEEVTFNQLGGDDRPEFHRDHCLLPEHAAVLASELPRFRAELAGLGLRLKGGAAYTGRIRASAEGRALQGSACTLGDRFLFVSERGTVSPCSFTAEAWGQPLGSLAPDALSERFRGLARQGPRASCEDCPSTQVFDNFGE